MHDLGILRSDLRGPGGAAGMVESCVEPQDGGAVRTWTILDAFPEAEVLLLGCLRDEELERMATERDVAKVAACEARASLRDAKAAGARAERILAAVQDELGRERVSFTQLRTQLDADHSALQQCEADLARLRRELGDARMREILGLGEPEL